MKKKRFYKNVKRNQQWTEGQAGREIDFADKYMSGEGIYSDKFDYMRPKIKKKRKRKADFRKFAKGLGIAVLCFLVISVGYTGMDVYMQRHAMPQDYSDGGDESGGVFNEIALNLKSEYAESVSLDGSVMLDSVITELSQGGCNSVTFDLKRSEGSVGYKSALSTVDTYGAIAFPATDLKGSVEKLQAQDILAVGRVYCYLDNLVPAKDSSAAVLNRDGIPYSDSKGNTYLNPDSETAYRYIKDIIAECAETGITVFVLDGVDLPDEISDGFNDGFDYLAKRLYADLGTDIKLLEAVNVSLNSSAEDTDGESTQENNNALESEISQKLTAEQDSNKIYFISVSAEKAAVKEKLEEGGIHSYILAD